MAILQLKSQNDKLSYIIRKHPDSGMQIRSLRLGTSFGWYSDEFTYNLYFRDAGNAVSYKVHVDEQYEYLNTTRYNSPLFVLGVLSEFFQYNIKNQDKLDVDGFENSLLINMINSKGRYIEHFNNYFQDVSITSEKIIHNSYRVVLTTNKSIHYLINITNLLALFLSIVTEEYLEVNDGILDKYLQCLNIVDAPFYIRYIFNRNFIRSKDKFKRFKERLETTDRYKISLSFGDTFIQRRDRIESILDFDYSIIDFGCGFGKYLSFARKLGDENLYYGIDINKEDLRKLEIKAKRMNLDNIATFSDFGSFVDTNVNESDHYDVILTEVIEHMEINEAKDLVKLILNSVKINKFVITTPNKDFNKYYLLSEELRDKDHKFEFTQEEFSLWVKDIFTPLSDDFNIEMLYLGDVVDDIHTTIGVLVKSKGIK